MAVITYEDVATSLGSPISDALQQAQVTLWITQTENVIRGRLGDLSLLDQSLLADVVTEAVVRRVKSPGAETRTTVTVDDATVSRTYESDNGRVVILDEWWELLSPSTVSDAFTIRPSYVKPTYSEAW